VILINLILRKVKINNFLSFKEAEYTNLKNYNVIIGKNSSGKSNLLKVFQMICDAYIVLEFEFSSEFRKELFLLLFNDKVFDRSFKWNEGKTDYPPPNSWKDGEYAYNWFKSKGYFINLLVKLKYDPHNSRLNLNKISIINENQEFLIFTLSYENNAFQENVLKIEDVKNIQEKLDTTFKASLIRRNNSSTSVVVLRNQINSLGNSNYLIGTLVKSFKVCFLENIFIIPEQRNFNPSMNTQNVNVTEISPDGVNLVKILHKKTVKTKREWTTKFNKDLRYFINDVEELKQDLDDADNTILILKEKGLDLNLYYENMGAGILNVAHFIACLMENPNGKIICIQEPELYLHPGLERKLCDYFLDKSKLFTFFITTHSREFLSQNESLCSTYLTKREHAQTKVQNIPLTNENFKLIYEDLDVDLTRIDEEKKLLSDPDFWAQIIDIVKEEQFEAKYWDFKQTLDFWHVEDPQIKRKKKIEFVEKIASFGNTEGGAIVIGITDEIPRKIQGISINENKLNELNKLILDLITPPVDFTRVQPITLKNEKDEDVICVCIVIAQSSEVLGVKHDNGTIKFVLRTTTGTVLVDPQVIKDKKKVIRRTNFNFIYIIKDKLNKNS
jgi:predicted ATP-dependent endonuclease of OLD family